MSAAKDLNLRVFIISALLTVLLAISNTYLALKVGLLTAASIPAAILSMGMMKFMRRSTMLEHNLVQTSASSGEAVAGGIVYTIPGLIVIGFWNHFPYFESVLIALLSGVLGVMFSAIIRRALLADKSLRFPEAHAITEVLRLKEERVLGFKEMIAGGLIAAVIEFLQSTGVAISSASKFLLKGASLFGFGVSFAPALVGAGFIIGVRVGLSLFLGAVLSYLVLLPLVSHGQISVLSLSPSDVFAQQFSGNVRYMGIGAMLVAALITLLSLLKPLALQVSKTLQQVVGQQILPVHDQDLSRGVIFFGILLSAILFYPLLTHVYALSGFTHASLVILILASIFYLLIVGFIAAIVCGYFSGLVGVSASPGSSVIIAGMIFAALLTHLFFALQFKTLSADLLMHGEAITIIVGGIVTGIACIANDTIQDLKVGQMIKASPRKQQIMLLFGVLIASLVIPLVMEVLYQAYGFVGHMPRANMNVNNALAIPPAAMMAALTTGVFNGAVPWNEMEVGALAMLILFGVNGLLLKRFNLSLSLLGVGVGMYLPLSSSTALIVGSLLALILQLRLRKVNERVKHIVAQEKLLLACGLVTGATLMDVVLAVPVALNPNGATLSFQVTNAVALGVGLITALILVFAVTYFGKKK